LNIAKISSETLNQQKEGFGISKMNKTLHYSHSNGHKIYGKEITHIWIDEMPEIKKELIWVEASRRFSLAARTRVMPRGLEVGVNETDMDPIQQWCEDHNCGRRVSFDTFQFKNKKQITMFLLKWG
jgi:hypothetical protein